MIVLIGPRGLGNTQQYERELAFVRQTRDPAFRVVPVILPENTTDPPVDFLQLLTWIDFSHVTRVFDAPDVLEQLLTAIRGGGSAAEGARETICPYRGLDAFREEDSAFFFGRGSADDLNTPIGELVSKVREHSFVMVVGRSVAASLRWSMPVCCQPCAASATGSEMRCPCGRGPPRCEHWRPPSIHARTTRALRNTQRELPKRRMN